MPVTGSAGSWALLALYYAVLAVLALYGVHRLVLVARWAKTRRLAAPLPPEPNDWPVVTVQLPLYNEMYVAERLIDAVARLDWPTSRLEIQVLDDSTDETTAVVARAVAAWRQRGVDVRHLRREVRAGFKAGALQAGLAVARGELVAVFDADFVPAPDFLRRTVPHFAADRSLGMVQGRWSHINRGYSLLTRVQAILLDGHFLVEHPARNRTGCFFNFNGTAGVWRRQAIVTAGGWQHDTLTEDLDLSYRAQLLGWKFLYLPDLPVASELPVDVNAFKSQQFRWSRGAIQTGRKLLGRVLAARLPWRVKVEALVHLTNNLSYPLMALLALLIFPAMVLRRGASPLALLLLDLPLFLAATLSVLIFYLTSQAAAGAGWRREIRFLPALLGLGIGLSIHNTQAVVGGLVRNGGTFHRTPKYRIERAGESWLGKRYRAGVGLSAAIEAAFALYFAGAMIYAVHAGMWASLPFLYLFLQGYVYMAVLSVAPFVRALTES